MKQKTHMTNVLAGALLVIVILALIGAVVALIAA